MVETNCVRVIIVLLESLACVLIRQYNDASLSCHIGALSLFEFDEVKHILDQDYSHMCFGPGLTLHFQKHFRLFGQLCCIYGKCTI